jgi:anti-sigma factor RsiW
MARGGHVPCERTRTLVSALLDGAGGEFERRLVEAHVRSCPECAEFRARATAITDMLRSAPLESVVCQVQVPRSALRHARARRIVSVAAAFAGIAFVGTLAQTVAPPQDPDEVAVIGSPLVQPLMGEESIRSLAREGLVQGVAAERTIGRGTSKPALPAIG